MKSGSAPVVFSILMVAGMVGALSIALTLEVLSFCTPSKNRPLQASG